MEHVTQIEPTGDADLARVRAVFARLGGEGDVRTSSRRDAEATFEWLVAAKARYPIASARRHECRHDEGIGDCSDAVVEG